MKLKLSYLLFIVSFGCNVDRSNFDSESPIKTPDDLTSRLYSHLKEMEYSKTYRLYVDTFFKYTDTSLILQGYNRMRNESGDVRSFKVSKREIKDLGKDTLYRITCDVLRSKKNTSEILEILASPNRPPKILHHMERKLFRVPFSVTGDSAILNASDFIPDSLKR